VKKKHLTDLDIQGYLFGDEKPGSDISDHITQCENCRIRTEQYKLIFEDVARQEKPVLGFDLVGSVMANLPHKRQVFSLTRSLIYILTSLIIPAAGIILYLFSTRLSGILVGLTPLFVALLATTVILLIAFQCLDTYMVYNKRMNALNSY
jgi:predicted RND superfamily exporter protein